MRAADLLDSWKEIAGYLKRDERTVRQWEDSEGLPVHRQQHKSRAAIFAYKAAPYGRSIPEYNQKQRAGVVPWQNRRFPSFL